MRLRRGFSLTELLIIVGILVTLAGMSIPIFTQYLIRSDLANAAQLTRQGLARARLLARSGELADSWGYASSGVVFRGSSYSVCDPSYDEYFTMPEDLETSGVLVVIFSRLTGLPDVTGDIILGSYGLEKRVSVTEHY